MRSEGQLTIGEVAALSGVPAKTIRYYEENGIIDSARRNENRYRTYSQVDVQALHFVAQVRRLGFSLKSVSELLSLYRNRNRASKDVKHIALGYLADLDRKIVELTAIKNTIENLVRRCHGDDRPECPIIEELDGSGDLPKWQHGTIKRRSAGKGAHRSA
jgi:MerR family copper efflux transcriptional regulator